MSTAANPIYIEENKTNDQPKIKPVPKIKKPSSARGLKQKKITSEYNPDIFLPVSNTARYENYDSKMLDTPILNTSNYQRALESQVKNTHEDKLKLRLLNYETLRETMTQCSAFPTKHRKFIWQYLLSLPNNIKLFQSYLGRGVHPFYKFINDMYPLGSEKENENLKTVCSLLAHWSPQVGNIYFLPHLVFPFVRSFPGSKNIHFIFETIIGVITSICNWWFEYYPGAPLYHLKLSEKIIQHEEPEIIKKFKEIYDQCGIKQMKPTEIIWRLIKNLFSESLIKEHWVQLMDFLICYNHKPEMILYVASAYIMKMKKTILTAKNQEDLKEVLYEINSGTSLVTVFKNAIKLYHKYNRYQLFKYKPYIPMDYTAYPTPIKMFPKDCIGNAKELEKEMMRIVEEYQHKDNALTNLEKNFKDLLNTEEKMHRHFISEINKENEKDEITKHELDIAFYHKMKYSDALTQEKIDKLTKLNQVIDKSLYIFDELNKAQIDRVQQEMQLKKEYETNLLTHKINENNLHKYDKDANRCISKLIDLRNKKQNSMEFNDYRDYVNKAKDFDRITEAQKSLYNYDDRVYPHLVKREDVRKIKHYYDEIGKMDQEFEEKENEVNQETKDLMDKIQYENHVADMHAGMLGVKFGNEVLDKYTSSKNQNNRSFTE